MGIGRQVGLICAKRGMSLRKLAIKAGIPYTTLYSAVKRDSDKMDLQLFARITEALDVSLVELLEVENKNTENDTRLDSIIENYNQLNEAGKDDLAKHAEHLTYIPEYTRFEDNEADSLA
ncbi:MAG TPA: helix-turn-helix transcriptional regulator [Candidatus Ruthenibacterium merdavium]|uniref:Helix-turn-helix transcriptional regulator n=1 Tax=Candidatus Ruthenibacterium merdavium TaxID=2838752 RepID=A0A9D2Q8F4_9FIRM|nr:helix-turn-helix transcriptional regulator [Candidatus Ruthenibacterium merdavium]